MTLVLGLVIVWIGMADILSQYQRFYTENVQFLGKMAGINSLDERCRKDPPGKETRTRIP
jgi:hypothetical protein